LISSHNAHKHLSGELQKSRSDRQFGLNNTLANSRVQSSLSKPSVVLSTSIGQQKNNLQAPSKSATANKQLNNSISVGTRLMAQRRKKSSVGQTMISELRMPTKVSSKPMSNNKLQGRKSDKLEMTIDSNCELNTSRFGQPD
jgi:hypothetical protein